MFITHALTNDRVQCVVYLCDMFITHTLTNARVHRVVYLCDMEFSSVTHLPYCLPNVKIQ